MKSVFFLVALLALTVCATVEQRDAIRDCIETLVDVDPADGEITAAELDAFLGNRTDCLPTFGALDGVVTGASIIALCDVDADTVLTIDDWNSTTTGCVRSPARIRYMTELCARCSA